jgi:hypothetical protein
VVDHELRRHDVFKHLHPSDFIVYGPERVWNQTRRLLRVILIVEDWSPKIGWGSDDDFGVCMYALCQFPSHIGASTLASARRAAILLQYVSVDGQRNVQRRHLFN